MTHKLTHIDKYIFTQAQILEASNRYKRLHKDIERNKDIAFSFINKMKSGRQLANMFGITPQRVNQIVDLYRTKI